MQPVSTLWRPEHMQGLSGWARVALVLTLAVGATLVQARQAAACSCGWPGYEAAIEGAEVAFIGTVVAKEGQPVFADPLDSVLHSFEVTRAKAPMPTPFTLKVAGGGGPSCGLDMSIGEEWVVIATSWDDGLQTNLCSGTVLASSLDPAELARIEGALPHDHPLGGEPIEEGFFVPMPAIAVGAVALIVALVSLVAFRRRRLS
jgi:hypothetical protein